MLINVLKRAIRSMFSAGSADPAVSNADSAVHRDIPAMLARAREAQQGGKLQDAVSLYEAVLEHVPQEERRARAALLINVGVILRELVIVPRAIERFRQALELQPGLAVGHYNLGLTLYETGNIREAETALRRAIEIEPDMQVAHSTLLCLFGFARSEEPEFVLSEHRRWAQKYADPLTASAPAHGNERSVERRLVVGYVSADFKEHSVARFIHPILANHDRSRFRIICYDNWAASDASTERLRSHADAWRKINDLDDEQAAGLVRGDGVDILVDLSGHTTGNRLLMFARKPAPVQAGWLGYMCTTGMAAMDWHITDAYMDPPGASEHWYVERLARIACAAAFEPHPDSPPVGPLPALANGFVRFGSFNNYIKIGDAVIGLWSRILAALPQSRLLLVVLGGDDPKIVEAVHARFERLAGAGDIARRVDVIGRRPMAEFLALFGQVDIALDPFPYGGGTTSLHTLWMGVPPVTLEGKTEIARSTSGMLLACGLDELVAQSPEEYLAICVRLAGNVQGLAELRAALRSRFSAISISDGLMVTRSLEEAYRSMWAEFVRSGRP